MHGIYLFCPQHETEAVDNLQGQEREGASTHAQAHEDEKPEEPYTADRSSAAARADAAEYSEGDRKGGEGLEGEKGSAESQEVGSGDKDGCRFRGDCHGDGYVKGGIVVGTSAYTGPDRWVFDDILVSLFCYR